MADATTDPSVGEVADGAPIAVRVGRGAMPPAVWRDLVAEAESVGIVHGDAWTGAVTGHLPGLDGVWLIAERGGRPVGGLPLIESHLGPFVRREAHHQGVPTAPLLAADLPRAETDAVLAALVDACRQLALESRCLGLQMCLDAPWDERLGPHLHAAGFRRDTLPVAVMPCEGGIDHVDRKVMRMNRRNERNRALKRGAEVGESTDPADVAVMHELYVEASARWGIDPPPVGLLQDLVAEGAGRTFLSVVRFEGRLVGAHLCWHDGDTVTAWLGATSRDCKEIYPATMVVWSDLVAATSRGARRLDLGGHGGREGVANFKRLLGADTCERGRWTLRPWTGRLVTATAALLRRGRG